FKDQYNDCDIIIPARCHLDGERSEVKEFNDRFEALYEQSPVKSFPNFAASGYDIANYFVNSTARNGGDFNKDSDIDGKGIQTDFRLKRVSNWGGFLNPVVYLLLYRPSGVVDEIAIVSNQ
ncbi:MAG: hypothetical protein K2F94_06565, partial [Muribaculaceae bacterium]|nr:hypothetical protein [Muribaculaceae bacterium]